MIHCRCTTLSAIYRWLSHAAGVHVYISLVLLVLSKVWYSFGYPSVIFIMIIVHGKWPNDDYFFISMDFTTLMCIFYCSRGSLYFPVHADGPIYSSLRDFGFLWVQSDRAIISIATHFCMWLLIDMVDRLAGLSYDPWHQKHELCTCTMDWESVLPL